MGKHHPPGGHPGTTLTGVVRHTNFSPKGGIEGARLDTAGGVVQVNLSPHQPLDGLMPGRTVTLEVGPEDTGKHPAGDHPVYRVVAVADRADPDAPVRVEGVVARPNYARHGEPNGVVLDGGDFVHLKPHGMRQAGLAVGDRVTAEGPARTTATGRWVVDATTVNGAAVGHPKPPHHH